MRQILNKSVPSITTIQKSLLVGKSPLYKFSTLPPNQAIQKAIQFQFKLRSMVKISDLYNYIMENREDIKKYGKTILLQFLNEYPMQSYRRSRDELDQQKREQKYKLRQSLYLFVNQFEDLNFYEKTTRYSVCKKLITYVGPDPIIIQQAEKYEAQLLYLLKNTKLHVVDLMNWLFMLTANYKQQFSKIAFDLIEQQFQNPQIREFYRSQRSLPAFIKRITEQDWMVFRKYKNIIKFICYEASVRHSDSPEELAITLERVVQMKFHLVGEKVIPKIVDEIMQKFSNEFELLTKNKQTIMRVFSTFKYLPLNYNIHLFNKIHTYLKSCKDLSSHLLIYLPYNKLSQNQVTFLQSKMFTTGRQDIASKLIYTIYQPQYKDVLTPFIVKEAYSNMVDTFKKEGFKNSFNCQIYIALMYRLSKLTHNFIDQTKMRNIFCIMAEKMEQQRYEVFQSLSTPGMISFFQLCQLHNPKINEKYVIAKIDKVLRSRKQRNSPLVYADSLLSGFKVHYNAFHKKSKYLLTFFIQQIINNPQVPFDRKTQLLFLIEKTIRPQPKWLQYSNTLSKQLTKDIEGFIQIYIKYEQKTLKLTNFVFNKLYERKAEFTSVIQLVSSLNLKLVTSLKGKLISPLKKYLSQMDLTNFDLNKSSLNTLVQAYRVLFYFKNQIPQFMEYFSIKIIQLIEQKCKLGQYVNGKQFASLSAYIMETLSNIDIKKKTQVIESIVQIIKNLRKKEGLYLKVYELDFLCNNQKYIKINNDVLQHHWNQIVESLKKTDKYEHHKQLFFLVIKLHCRQFVELNSFDLRYFIDKCMQLIDDSSLNLTQIKECLGYDILRVEDEFIIQKMKMFLSGMVKLAFRKDKRKHSYFMYEYYLKFFSKIQSSQMITQICQKLLYEKLYPVEVSNIVPILSKNQIKSKKFVDRILDIMSLSEAYVSYEKLQVISWLEKILYEMPEQNYSLNSMKIKIHDQISERISAIKLYFKSTLKSQQRSAQQGSEVDDPNFDKNYKVFIEYAWSCLKSKNVYTQNFKFICRYLFFSIQKIKARIQNPEERKQLSKIKLFHVLKYLKECGFFQIDQNRLQNSVRQKSKIMEKIGKSKLLNKFQRDLSVIKLQSCEKLQKRLAKHDLMEFKHKYQIQTNNSRFPIVVEYFVQQRSQKNNILIKNNFVIHTVKKYHYTRELDSVNSAVTSTQGPIKSETINKRQKIRKQEPQTITSTIEQQIDIFDEGQNLYQIQDQENNMDQDNIDSIKPEQVFLNVQQTQLSLQMQPDKQFFTSKDKQKKATRTRNSTRPLFGSQKKKQSEQTSDNDILQKKLQTVLSLEPQNQSLYKDYNGYLKVQKSLIQLTTGIKCIIYDPERDIFFD